MLYKNVNNKHQMFLKHLMFVVYLKKITINHYLLTTNYFCCFGDALAVLLGTLLKYNLVPQGGIFAPFIGATFQLAIFAYQYSIYTPNRFALFYSMPHLL